MKFNTRFNPTISGALHVGHLYVALVNEAEAHRSGGKFSVRVDDTQKRWTHLIKKDLRDQYYTEYRNQLNQFMEVDVWYRQSQMPTPVEVIGDHPLLKAFPIPYLQDRDVEWQEKLNRKVMSYLPHGTLDKVIWDFYGGTNLLIRGDDLITESHLYAHFVEEVGLPRVYQIYLPRLTSDERRDDIQVDVSKTTGKYPIEKQLDAFGAEETLHWLRQSCLIDPDGEFLVTNVKPNPVVIGLKI